MIRALVVVIIAGALVQACLPGIRSVKPAGETARTSPESGPAATGSSVTPKGPEKGKDDKSGPSRPEYKPPPPPQEKTALSAVELKDREAVNEAALKFAKHIQGVEHIKTCYSRLYGGWYVFYYIKKGKNISVQQYSWDPKTQEWEIIYHLKELAPERLEYHLKGEVDDEKCFRLK
jgi:hypothetical protein